MRLPERPLLPASIQCRSTTESRQFFDARLAKIFHVIRKSEGDRQAHASEHRGTPQDIELSRSVFLDLEIGRTRLVRRKEGDGSQQEDDQAAESWAEANHSGPSPDGAGTCLFG